MKKLFTLLLLLLLLLPSILSLLHPGFFLSDDGEWMIIRFSAFHQALTDGQFPVRWLGRLNHEYGYPVANFLYPGFMYLAEPIHLMGAGFVDTIKIIFGLSMVGSAVFSYLWLAKLFGKWAAFVGALFYLYTPYHLFDLYKRGSIGELLALAVLPFIFWMIERKSVIWASIGIGMLILSHNTLVALFLPVIIGYMLIRRVSSIKYQVSSIMFGLGISAFFWTPALYDLQYTRFFQTQVSNWQDYFADLKLIGIGTLAIMVIALVSFLRSLHKDGRKYYSTFVGFLIVGLISVFLSLSMSVPLWQVLPVSFIQFPFRLLSIAVVSTAFLAAFTVEQTRGITRYITLAALLILIAFSAFPYIGPSVFFDKGDSYYATNEDTTNVQNEYMPKWVEVLPTERPLGKVEAGEETERVHIVSAKSNEILFKANMITSRNVRANVIYFPGWKVYVDGKESLIDYNNERGIMQVMVPQSGHEVRFRFSETPVRLVSDVISIVSFLILFAFATGKRRKV